MVVLLATASVVTLNSRGGDKLAKVPQVLVPHSGACSPEEGFLYSNTVDSTTMNICISREGNINSIEYPAAGSNQIAWDGYCLFDSDTSSVYSDYSPGSGTTFGGWNLATLTVAAANQVNVTRTSTDGKYQLTEFIKINFQPRSIFVGMTIKNVDPSQAVHRFYVTRAVAPAIEGGAADDQYNEFGVGPNVNLDTQYGRVGQAFQSPGPATNSLLFGITQQRGVVFTSTVADYQSTAPSNCGGVPETPGLVTGGNRVLVGGQGEPGGILKTFAIAHNVSANIGKFVYRMV